MKLIKAFKLKKGDAVGVIAPSEPVFYKQKFSQGVKKLEKMGLKVVLGKNVFKRRGGYMAGTVQERLGDFHAMIKNKKIKAIFTARGGFCSNQLLRGLDYNLIKKHPKIIFGFSDITVLLNAIHKKIGLVTFCGPNVENIISRLTKYAKNSLIQNIFIAKPIGSVKPLTKWKVLKKGRAAGRLAGGNLSVLRTLLGTEFQPDWKGTILFLEDVSITYEDLDHFLTHLDLAGVFEKIKGMVIGKLSKLEKIESKSELNSLKFESPEKIILDRTKKYRFPIISNVDFGHVANQITIPIGVKATIDTAKKLFSIDESAVR